MAYWLDYSSAKLNGSTIAAAGYTGVIRYIDSPDRLATKHTNKTEYDSHRAAGLSIMLVMQTTTNASDGGFPVGQDHARRALAGANYLGYRGPVFFTNDRTSVPNIGAWHGYLDGAASVLGLARTGAYGFRNAMDLAIGRASYFWQAGRRADVAAHTHVWQDNNTQVTVGGVLCDRNLILRNIELEDEVSWNAVLTVPEGPNKGKQFTAGTMMEYANYYAGESFVMLSTMQAELAAIAKNPDITPEQLTAVVHEAVAAHTPTAEQIAAAINVAQRPHIKAAVRAVLGEDNDEQAEAVVDELVSRLSERAVPDRR